MFVFTKEAFAVNPTVANKISIAIGRYLVEKDPSYLGKKIEVSFKYADRVFRELNFRKGNVTFSVAELYPDFKPVGNIIVPIQVTVDGVDKEKIFLRTKVSVFDKIVVAKKRFKRGDVIASGEAALEERDIAALSSNVIRDLGLVMNKEIRAYIPKDNPVYDWMIKERSLVKKNEKIRIIASTQNVTVEASGISLEDGLMGSEVKVKNLNSGKELSCIVIGTGEVATK